MTRVQPHVGTRALEFYEQWVALEPSFGDISSGAANAVVVILATEKERGDKVRSRSQNSKGYGLFTNHLLNLRFLCGHF